MVNQVNGSSITSPVLPQQNKTDNSRRLLFCIPVGTRFRMPVLKDVPKRLAHFVRNMTRPKSTATATQQVRSAGTESPVTPTVHHASQLILTLPAVERSAAGEFSNGIFSNTAFASLSPPPGELGGKKSRASTMEIIGGRTSGKLNSHGHASSLTTRTITFGTYDPSGWGGIDDDSDVEEALDDRAALDAFDKGINDAKPEIVAAINKLSDTVVRGLDSVDQKLDSVNQKLDSVNQKLESMAVGLKEFNNRLEAKKAIVKQLVNNRNTDS